MITILLIYLPLCFLMGFLALSKNRSFAGWFLIAVFFSPIIAILALIVVPVLPPPEDDILYLRRPRPRMALHAKLLIAAVMLAIGVPLLMPGLFVSKPVSITQAATPAAYDRPELAEFFRQQSLERAAALKANRK
jgi:hypothetical protein